MKWRGRTRTLTFSMLQTSSQLKQVKSMLHLVVDHSHVKVAELLQRIGQVGVGLGHMGVEHNAAIVESYALLIVA